MKVIGWKCWCLDTSVSPRVVVLFTSMEHTWADVPNAVLVRMIYFDQVDAAGRHHYRRVEMGQQRYWYDPINEAYDSTMKERVEVLAIHPDADIRDGLTANDQLYAETVAEAMADHDYAGMDGIG